MVKNVNMVFGPFDLPSNLAFAHINVALLNGDNAEVTQSNIAPDTAVYQLNVPAGTGWKIRVQNRDQFDGVIGSEILTDAFDVIENITVQIVTGVTLS